MGLFSRPAQNDDMAPTGSTPAVDQSQLQIALPQNLDAASLKDYITQRLIIESQIGDSSASRISALKALADVAVVKEEVKFRVDKRLADSTTNIVVVQEALRNANRLANAD